MDLGGNVNNKEIEELGKDSKGQPSSLSAFKSGENRGRRKPEKDGCWIHMSGYSYDAFSVVRAANNTWAKSLLKTGLRVGKLWGDGCVEFYVFQEDNKL